jgi:hypothetical protein
MLVWIRGRARIKTGYKNRVFTSRIAASFVGCVIVAVIVVNVYHGHQNQCIDINKQRQQSSYMLNCFFENSFLHYVIYSSHFKIRFL